MKSSRYYSSLRKNSPLEISRTGTDSGIFLVWIKRLNSFRNGIFIRIWGFNFLVPRIQILCFIILSRIYPDIRQQPRQGDKSVKVSGIWIAGIVFVLLFCVVAGCTNPATSTSSQAGGGSGGNGGGSGGGTAAAGAVSYPPNTYFTLDCKGEWQDTSISPDHFGSFTLTGNVTIHITYDYENPTGYEVYSAVTLGTNIPLTIHAESEGCWEGGTDCKHCHFIYDGQLFAGAQMAYNRTNDPGPWTVAFMQMPGGEGIWHTVSFTQTDANCPITIDQTFTPQEAVGPASSCFTLKQGGSFGQPFSFSDGSEFEVSPHQDSDVVFTSLKPTATFHIGRAPS